MVKKTLKCKKDPNKIKVELLGFISHVCKPSGCFPENMRGPLMFTVHRFLFLYYYHSFTAVDGPTWTLKTSQKQVIPNTQLFLSG